jgi:hypothetical protein
MTSRYVQDPGLHMALQRQVAAALAAVQRGDVKAKSGALRGYINLVQAQSGKGVSSAAGRELIALARTL